MANLTIREVAEIQRREKENALRREAERRRWNNSAEGWAAEVEKNRQAAQRMHVSTGEWLWKRGPVEVLLRHSPSGLRMIIRFFGNEEVRVELARYDQKVIFDHIRHTIGNFGRETRENGALVGLKMLYVNGQQLRSPSRHTPWNRVSLKADHPPTEDDRNGIYALWPARKNPNRIYSDLWSYLHPEMGVLARVLGTGRCVIGTRGWRAENCIVTDLWTTPKRLYQLEHFKMYGVKTHSWDENHGNR